MSKKDVRLRRRIRYAAYKRETGDETLQDISNEIGVSQASIYNHVKKHMEDISDRYEGRRAIYTAKKQAEVSVRVIEEAETVIKQDQIEGIEMRPVEIIGLDDYIALGIADIKNGNMKMTAQTWLAAVKIKTDWSKNRENNKLDFLKAIYAYSSGDKKEKDNVKRSAAEDAESNRAGEEQPNDIYRAATGTDPS